MNDAETYARSQHLLAETGQAEGQCPCGSYRIDGGPPVLHHDGCPHKDDWKADPLASLEPGSGAEGAG